MGISKSYLKELAKKKKFGQEGLEKKEDDRIVVPSVLQDDKDFYYKFMQSPRYNAMLEGKHYTPFTRFTDLTYSENPIYSGRKERGNIRSKMWSIADAPYLIGTLQKHPQSAADREDFRQKRLPIESAEYIKNARLQNLEEKNPDIYTYPSIEQFVNRRNREGLAPSGFSEFKTGDIYMNPFYYEGMKDIDEDTRFNILRWLPSVGQVETHELSHTIDRPKGGYEHLIPIEDITAIKQKTLGSQQKFLDEDKYDRWKYLSTPTEVRARLNVVRKALNDKGIDIGTKTIEPEDLESLKDTDVSDLNDLRDILKEEDIIWMLNNISKNETPQKEKYAKSGAYIPTEDKQFSVKKSTIPGANKGLFSKTPIKQGKLIGLAHENNQPVGTLGNMHNHSETPNMQSVKVGNQRYVYATRDIQPGEELTTNYRLQPELEQPEDFMGNKRFGQKGFYKPDFRTKSQIAADYGNTGESTKVAPKINPVDMRKAQEAAMQRAIANQPTFRQGRTLSANEQAENQARLAKIRDQQKEEENRRRLTFTGNAEARGAGTLMQPLLDVINPFSYYYSGKDALRGLGQAAEGVTNLDLGQIGSGLAGATFGVLGAIPTTSEFKPLFGAAGKTFAKPALKAASSLGKPGVSRNLADLQAAKKFAKQYGYELPKNLKRVAESDVLTDRTIRGLMNRHNTVVRGVSTNWDEIQKHVPTDVWNDIVKNFEKEGIDYINNPKAAAEYMATHIPVRTGYGRVGLKPGEDALYLSNSMPTAEGYTYGQGYAVKAKRPTDFSSVNRQDWIKANEFPVSYGFKNSPFGTGIVKSDYAKRVPTSLRDVAYAAGDPSIIQNAIKRSEEAYDLARTRHSGLQQKYVDKMWNRRLDFIEKNNPELLGKGSIWKYKMPLADRAKELYYNSLLGASNISKELSGIPPIVGGLLDRRNMAALGKNLFSPVFGRMDPYAHYIFKGTPGEKVLEPIRSVKITPEMWSNQSRAHVGKYSRGLTRRELGGTIPAKTYQGGGTNIDLKLPQFGEDKPRPFFEITGAGTGPQYDVFGYGYVPLGKNLGISADLMRWKEGDWRGGGYGISGNINIPINRGERKIRPTVKDPVMFQGGGTMGIPGVNGQVVSSGPTPLTSVKKTRGSMSMDNEGNIKTMPTKAVKKILKNIK